MSETFCRYPGNREHMLVAHLYDDISPAERSVFESHLAECATCRRELAGLGTVREQLADWAPPDARLLTSRRSQDASHESQSAAMPAVGRSGARGQRWWQEIPAWAQVAAALLFLGVSAGLANLHVTYDRNGLAVRTGWLPASSAAAGVPSGEPTAGAAPWRADLANLEQQLRSEMHVATNQVAAVQKSGPSAGDPTNAEIIRRVKALIGESERKEQRELALRVAEVFRDVQAQRQGDLVKIERSLGVLQNNTGFEVMRQRELLKSLAVRVSQTR